MMFEAMIVIGIVAVTGLVCFLFEKLFKVKVASPVDGCVPMKDDDEFGGVVVGGAASVTVGLFSDDDD